MKASLNAPMQIENHEKLVRILNMITLCQRYIEGDTRTLNTEACNWLSTLKTETENRIAFRRQVLLRLQKYYARQVFNMASEVYESVNVLTVARKQN